MAVGTTQMMWAIIEIELRLPKLTIFNVSYFFNLPCSRMNLDGVACAFSNTGIP